MSTITASKVRRMSSQPQSTITASKVRRMSCEHHHSLRPQSPGHIFPVKSQCKSSHCMSHHPRRCTLLRASDACLANQAWDLRPYRYIDPPQHIYSCSASEKGQGHSNGPRSSGLLFITETGHGQSFLQYVARCSVHVLKHKKRAAESTTQLYLGP